LVRLNRYLSLAGVASRRKADLLIQCGRVELNGKRVQKPGTLVHEKNDEVRLDGVRVNLKEDFLYLILNKPAGFLTTMDNGFKRPVILDLIRGIKTRIFPVGRLDYDTQGVLLLTNDGDLAYRLTHPRFQIARVYKVKVRGKGLENKIKTLKKGIRLEDGKLATGEGKILEKHNGQAIIKLELKEGRKREIKRIFKALGCKVEQLERVSFGGIRARGLKSGEWRHLSPAEVFNLRKMTGLEGGSLTG